jgi:hypothetical protein
MKPGPKPSGKISTEWTPDLAYSIGLLASDGNLSKDGRHLNLTSKDRVQIILFKKCLRLKTKIGKKNSGKNNLAYQTQFGDVLFYKFLLTVGLTPRKSNTMSSLAIPDKYFFDFLRGYFDGDGCSYSYYDKVWKNSFRFYISFASGSIRYIEWLRKELTRLIGVRGHISRSKRVTHIQLKYSKNEAIRVVKEMYYAPNLPSLKRKRLKIYKSLSIIG